MEYFIQWGRLLCFFTIFFAQTLFSQSSETNERFYNWHPGALVMDQQRYNTTPYPGYVIMLDGSRIDGILELMRVDNSLRKIKLDTPAKKLVLEPSQVRAYGLYVRKDRAVGVQNKPFSEMGKNFLPGSVTLLDGTVHEGWVAFADADTRYYDYGQAFYYRNVYYAPGEDGLIDYYPTEVVESVSQQHDGHQIDYQYLDNNFVNLDNVKAVKIFWPGTVTFRDGSTQNGNLSRLWANNIYLDCIFFETPEGRLRCLRASNVQNCRLKADGEERAYVPYRGVLVELINESEQFTLTINPYSTTPSMFANFMLEFASSAARGMVANEVAKGIARSVDADSKEFRETLNTASKEELMELEDNLAYLNAQLGDDPLSDEIRKKIAAQRIALRVASQGRPDEIGTGAGGPFMRREYVLTNTLTGSQIIFVKTDMKRQLEHQLSGCGHYVVMPKKEQKELLKWENMPRILTLMDQCF